jgi:thiamine biosynthesis lipoprotein
MLKKIAVFIALLVFFLGCKKNEKLNDFTFRGNVFGTTYKITYLKSSKNYKKSIDSLFKAVNKSLSTYIPTSYISRINKGDTTVIVDELFMEVFQKSQRIYTETDGYFDPTVGNLVNAWGFGPKNEKKNLSKEEVKREMEFVGLDKVKVLNRRVIKNHQNIYLDFNSIAKGYGIDVVARFFNLKKIENYLIEIGGEIRTKGQKGTGRPWVVQLVDPLKKDTNKGFKKINLSNKSMATSGNYRKFRLTENEKKYVHTINPKTGYALESNLLSVSVISDLDCADVDAYATSFMAMGFEKTKFFIENHKNLDVILLYVNNEGKLQEYTNYTYK